MYFYSIQLSGHLCAPRIIMKIISKLSEIMCQFLCLLPVVSLDRFKLCWLACFDVCVAYVVRPIHLHPPIKEYVN